MTYKLLTKCNLSLELNYENQYNRLLTKPDRERCKTEQDGVTVQPLILSFDDVRQHQSNSQRTQSVPSSLRISQPLQTGVSGHSSTGIDQHGRWKKQPAMRCEVYAPLSEEVGVERDSARIYAEQLTAWTALYGQHRITYC